ncbi:MAG: cyclic nucleotide-binding domain-containing protein [Deltaproteobacteria bacterium]|nr:cyclic nucleotide-binding domain-containing protein [Deltaproteobacteria bacterium]NIS77638.1 cyclic nucleotide-binding domain-containing protein [Deltaproteobacteria bacterium]
MENLSEKIKLWFKKDLPIFRYLTGKDVKTFPPSLFEQVNVYKGETVCVEGKICDYVALILSGKIEIKKDTDFAGKQVVIGILSEGSVVGEMWLLEDHPGPVTAVAVEDSILLMMSRQNFNTLIENDPVMGVKLLKGVLLSTSIRLRKAYDRMAAIF